MTALATALTTVAALLVVVAGIAKLARPYAAVDAIGDVGLPSSATFVRALALGELGVGAASLLTASSLARALLVLTYVGFAAFVALGMRRGTRASCGCFGAQGAPLGWRHVAVNLLLASGVAATLTTTVGSIASSVATLAGGAALAVAAVSTMLIAVLLSRGRVA